MADDAPLHICQILAPGAFGGLESVVVALATGLAQRGHEIRVLALLESDGRCSPIEALPPAVVVKEIRLPHGRYLTEIKRLAAELGEVSGAIAHTHGYHADLVGLRAARRAGRRIVSTVHGFTVGGWKNRLYEWWDRRALAGFDAAIAVSRPLAALLQRSGVPVDRIHTIPNAYDDSHELLSRDHARRLLGLPPDVLIAGWVGRLSHEKGPDVFIRALALAPEWHGSVVGSGPLEASLRETLAGSVHASRVHWHGVVPGAGAFLRAFDVVVLTSRTEGTPIVLLEAMAAAVPVIATTVGGIPDVVGSEEAILIPSEDAAAVAAALQRIRTDAEAARVRAEVGAIRLQQSHALGPWLEQYERVYRELEA